MSLTKATYSMISGAQVNALDLVTGGSGTSGDPWTGWNTNIDWTQSGITYVFPKGVWAYSVGIQIDGQSISIIGLGGSTGTEFKFNGVGRAFTLNSEATKHLIQDILIRGNALATDAIFLNLANHGIIRNVRVVDFTDAGLRTNWTVTELIDTFVVSGNDAVPYSFLPDYGIYLDSQAGEYTTTVTILNPIIETVQTCGIYFARATLNTVIGGTSENIPTGIWITDAAGSNTIIGIDLESNTVDLKIDSATNNIFGVIANVVEIDGTLNSFFGGRLINLNLTGNSNSFYGVYSPTIVDTAYGNMVYGATPSWNYTNNLNNANFEVWTSGTSVAPDSWTLSGAASSVERESTIKYLGSYSTKITRAGTDTILLQNISTDLGLTYWKDKQVTMGCWVYATVANQAFLFMQDGIAQVISSAHPGDSTWRFLSCTFTVSSTASTVRLSCAVNNVNGAAYFDGAIGVIGPLATPFSNKPAVVQSSALASSGTGTIKMGTGNAANSAGFLSVQKSDGTTVYVPYFTTDTP